MEHPLHREQWVSFPIADNPTRTGWAVLLRVGRNSSKFRSKAVKAPSSAISANIVFDCDQNEPS